MRIKGNFAKGIVIILVLTLVPMSAFSVQKIIPGTTCKVYKQKVNNQKKIYTCIKSGNKLVWNKGINIKSPTLTPTPIPTQTISPMPSTSPSPTISPTPAPTPNATFTNTFENILFNSIDKVQKLKHSQNRLNFFFQTEDNFNKEAAILINNSQSNVMDIFGNLFEADTTFNVIQSNSYEYVIAKMKELGGYDSWISTQLPGIRNAYPVNSKISRPIWAFATYLNFNKEKPILVYMSYPEYKFDLSVQEIGAHEIFHLIQEKLDSSSGNLPCWIHEGQASFIGTALGNTNLNRDDLIRDIKSFGGLKSAGIDLNMIEAPSGWMKNGHGSCDDVGEYQVGRIANAYLIDRYGVDKNLEFLKKMNGQPGDGSSWKKIFEESFGLSVSDFYTDIEPYLRWFFKKYFNQS